MKVLLMSPLPPPFGGIATWTQGYIEGCKELGIDQYLVNTAIKGKRVNDFTKKNLINEFVRAFNIFKNVKKELKKRIDVVHVNTSCSHLGMITEKICIKLCKKKNVKVVVHCHCNVQDVIDSDKLEKQFVKFISLADEVIVLNTKTQKFLLEKFCINSCYIPNFLKTIEQPFKDRIISKNVNKLMYVGRVTNFKGCDLIIKVAKYFPNKEFTLVGNVSQAIRAMQVTDNVVFKGEQSRAEVFNLMRESDVLVFPSHTEGFPTVVLEAMLMGLPIITTFVGAIGDMIEDKGGKEILINDLESFIKAINEIDSQSVRSVMSRWNIEKVINDYSLEKIMLKYKAVYDRCILK